ncbi:MAG: metallophosphoesterase [Oscillospiraceae bacterium]|jgi:hypothetical protein|nr:metallophosphoesterase [Oscillospiraceae bacterium]
MSIQVLSRDPETGAIRIQKNGGGALRLAVFTDLHFDGFDPVGMLQTKHWLRCQTEALRPDLIAVLGDTALCPYNRGRTQRFAALMESLGVPWTAVLGNHEGEGKRVLTRRDTVACYQTSARFLGYAELPGVTGYGNQMLEIVGPDGRPMQRLWFMDSGGGRQGHSYVQKDQTDWLRRTAADGTVPGMVFLHVPLHQYQAAYEALARGEAELIRGQWRESVCLGGGPDQSDALVEAARAAGVWAFVCGHDHSNDFDLFYQGMHYIYTQSGGYSRLCYDARSRGVRGCTVYEIETDGRVTVRQNRNPK